MVRCVSAKLGQMVSRQRLEHLVAEHGGNYRDRIYPPLVTLSLFVEQVISVDQACQDAVGRALSQRTTLGQARCSLNTGPYCKARRRLALPLVERVAREVAARMESQAQASWKWRGRTVKLIDGTTVSMPDTAANQDAFPQNHEQKPGLGFPLARIVGIISLATGGILESATSACEGAGSAEIMQFGALLNTLATGEVIIGDRAYSSYFMLAELGARGVDAVFREHQCRKNDPRGAQRLGRHDHLITWNKPERPRWMDEATYAAMPEQLTVREVKDGDWSIVTTLTDPRHVTREEILWLYRQRWNIELDFRAIKSVMQMDVLRCKTPAMVKKEIAAHLMGYNLIRAAMVQAARGCALLPRQLSFAAARRAFARYQECIRHRPAIHLTDEIERLLAAIAAWRIPCRPNRVEPRAVKRRPKPHPLLTVPRHVARLRLLRQRAHA